MGNIVAVVGRPNVGKSTLMNALVGEKLSIITSKAQTTRHRILGIVNDDDYQIIFSDTPGILKPNYKLQEKMMEFVVSAFSDADVFLLIVDIYEDIVLDEKYLEKLKKTKTPVLLLLNKIDLARKINSKEAIKIASDYEKKIGLYSKEYIKGDKGLLSEEFKGNANAMFEKVKNSPLVLGEINKYKSFLDALGDKNPKIKKMFEDVDSKMKEDIKNSTNSATSTTVDYNHKHTFEYKATPGYMESLNRENVRNPGQFNEWAERNSKEFTTPNTAVKN